ncbi:hypothetical protein ACFQHW_10275 [Lapidilactobacillus achengensis]|uniref:Uncharacterized protein n=1 Tax=Lapidilactobacillus achengensis TaxID=2486000 RepID=A0ABW1UPQ5_9LACO|nr:hypothetical protein [Lapidilactobacillus achengensis]
MASPVNKPLYKIGLYEENDLNKQFHENQVLPFYSELLGHVVRGRITKKYRYSCLIDISNSDRTSEFQKEQYNSHIVVSYRDLQPEPTL